MDTWTISASVYFMSVIYYCYLSEGRNIYISDSYQQAYNASSACRELFFPSEESYVNITNSPSFTDQAWTGNSWNATTGTCIAITVNSTGKLAYNNDIDCKRLLPVFCAKLNEYFPTILTTPHTTNVQDLKMETIILISCILAAVIGLIGIFIAVWCVRRKNMQTQHIYNYE